MTLSKDIRAIRDAATLKGQTTPAGISGSQTGQVLATQFGGVWDAIDRLAKEIERLSAHTKD